MLIDDLSAKPGSPPRREQTARERIVYVAPDWTDSAVKKRAHAFQRFGHELLSFSFRRDRYNIGRPADWPNIELGKSTERRLGARILVCFRALWIIWTHRRAWRRASMIDARNLDLAVLAVLGRWITLSRAPLVYEVLDVHPVLTRQGWRSALMRWVERRVLRRTALLVVSSPAFLRAYFLPLQGYRGETFLLENKWSRENVFSQQRALGYEPPGQTPVWTIGWFGNLRCPQSLAILCDLADALPDRVRIYLRGCASLLGEELMRQALHGRHNVVFEGEYNAPDELPEIYSRVHFNWCADFSDGDNSLWLLPNRMYEGGYYGIPALAIAGHETGRVVEERGLGFALQPPYVESLKGLLQQMDRTEYQRLRARIEGLPDSCFVDGSDVAHLMSLQMAKR